MFEKDNRFYADWRDRKGVRRRKAFTTADAAQLHEETQKNASRPKRKGAGLRSTQSSAPSVPLGTQPTPTPIRAMRLKTSKKLAAARPRRNSTQRT